MDNQIQIEQSGGYIFTGIWMMIVSIFDAIAKFLWWLGGTFFDLRVWNLPEGKGLFWKYLWWCGKVSLYLSIFMLGGMGITMIGIIYVYRKLYIKVTTPQNIDEEKIKDYLDMARKFPPAAYDAAISDAELADRRDDSMTTSILGRR